MQRLKSMLKSVFALLGKPATPYLLVGAVLIGLSTAGVAIWLSGASAPITYTNLPNITGELIADSAPPPQAQTEQRSSSGVPPIDRSTQPAGSPPIDIIPALIERSDFGLLPKTDPEAGTPLQRYSRQNEGSPVANNRIALILTDLGMLPEISEKATLLPSEIALAFSAYAPNTAEWLAYGRSKGHEVLLELPLKSSAGTVDRGPLALSAEDSNLIANLRRILGRATGYIGLTAEAGDFASQSSAFQPIADEFRSRGLAFVELGARDLRDVSRNAGLPYLSAALAVDTVLDPSAIEDELGRLEQNARANGYAVGLLRPYPLTLDLVWRWSQGLESRALTLVTVSSLLQVNQ